MHAPSRLQNAAAVLYSLPFVWVGVQHFVNPEAFVPIVPGYLGWPEFWVHVTGWTEIAVGVGIMIPRFRRTAATLMMAQLALLYLANLHMWVNDIAFEGQRFGHLGHSVRLAIQILLIGAAAWIRSVAPLKPKPTP